MTVPSAPLRDWLAARAWLKQSSLLIQALIAAGLLLAGVLYHLVYVVLEETPGTFSDQMFHLLAIVAYGMLFRVLDRFFHARRSGPIRIFWVSLLHGIFTLALVALILGEKTPGIQPISFLPTDPTSVLQIHLITFLIALFAFSLLLRFRSLVLFKRTAGTLRNWYVMLALMAASALAMWGAPPGSSLNLPAILLVSLTMGFMLTNAFRLSWVVYLSFREKLTALLLSSLFLFLDLTILIGPPGLPDLFEIMETYSYPVSFFAQLCLAFGGIYATTSLLSLLFHLPTTGDFQRKMEELAALHSLSRLVSQVFDFDQLVTTIVQSPVESGIASATWLVLIRQKEPDIRFDLVATSGISREQVIKSISLEPLVREVLRRRKPLVLEDTDTERHIHYSEANNSLKSLAVIPLIARNEPLGMLFVARNISHGFEEDDLEALTAFADQAALALDNARLFQEQLEKERLARELAIAREVQLKLLPRKLPQMPGLSLHGASIPATEVGGDYFDARKLHNHQLAVIVADVAGKGTSAAFYMAEMRGIFHALTPLKAEPRDFICLANQALISSLERNVFISTIYGLVDIQKETVQLARAGHCPAALVRISGEARYLQSRGLAIGLERTERFCKWLETRTVSLEPGDVLVFFTDGLVESRNERGEEYGYDRLLTRIQHLRYADAQEIYEGILEDLRQFVGSSTYGDDLTLIVLKWSGVSPPYERELISSEHNMTA